MIPYVAPPPGIEVGGLTLYPYGALLMLGGVIGTVVALTRVSRARGGRGVAAQAAIAASVLLSGGPVAHLAYAALYAPGLDVEGRGLAAVGVVAVTVFAAAVWLPLLDRGGFWSHADATVSGLVAAWIPGRVGCFLVHDHVGQPTSFPLAVRGICTDEPGGAACHDLGLYELFLAIGCAGLLAAIGARRFRPGTAALVVGGVASAGRFLLDFMRRADSDPRWSGLTAAQWLAGALLIAVIVAATQRSRSLAAA